MRERKIPTLRKKLLVWFLIIINISTFFGFSAGNYIALVSTSKEHDVAINHIADTIIGLSNLHTLSIDEIYKITTSTVYPVKKN